MEKSCCQITVFDTDSGYRVEIRGEGVKEARQACCGDAGRDETCCSGNASLKLDCCEVQVKEATGGFDVTYDGDKSRAKAWLQKMCARVRCC